MPKSLPQEGHPSKPGRSGMASTSGEIREAPLLAITREGPWLWTACYQLRPWPRRLDLSISRCPLFCSSEKKGSSWLILGSSLCVVSLLGVINNSIKISQCTRQATLDRGCEGSGSGGSRRTCNGAMSHHTHPILKCFWLLKSGLHVSPIWHNAGCHLGKKTCLMFSPHWQGKGALMERNFRPTRNKQKKSLIITLNILTL